MGRDMDRTADRVTDRSADRTTHRTTDRTMDRITDRTTGRTTDQTQLLYACFFFTGNYSNLIEKPIFALYTAETVYGRAILLGPINIEKVLFVVCIFTIYIDVPVFLRTMDSRNFSLIG
jgi:hypothetical protein